MVGEENLLAYYNQGSIVGAIDKIQLSVRVYDK
jgi:hypothetical protein